MAKFEALSPLAVTCKISILQVVLAIKSALNGHKRFADILDSETISTLPDYRIGKEETVVGVRLRVEVLEAVWCERVRVTCRGNPL